MTTTREVEPILRGKFLAATLAEPGVETVRGVGYRFRDSETVTRS